MSYIKTFLKPIHIVLACIAITACSETTKTVQWEEEVPLNTGEVIWVKRSDTYSRRSEPGNPLKMGWWPYASRSYKFSWNGQPYLYEVNGHGAPILLHVDIVENEIVIIDSAWPTCAGYGVYKWVTGKWQLQPNGILALVGQPRNLMAHSSPVDGEIPPRVTQSWIRSQHFELPQRGSIDTHLLESKIDANCTRIK